MSARATATTGSFQRESEAKTENRGATRQNSNSELSESSMHEDIARLAYALWQQRGCPEGSAEFDWFEAERNLQRTR
jgi:hypothetical protein